MQAPRARSSAWQRRGAGRGEGSPNQGPTKGRLLYFVGPKRQPPARPVDAASRQHDQLVSSARPDLDTRIHTHPPSLRTLPSSSPAGMWSALRRPLPVAARLPTRPVPARRFLASTLPRLSSEGGEFPPASPERAEDEVDVCIVGAGPAGLCAAIRLKQLEQANPGAEERRVIVLEKGAEVGSHVLSGAVIETKALDELLPNWKELGAPVRAPPVSSSCPRRAQRASC